MTDINKLKALAEAATKGDWQVIENELPCRLGGVHIERRIFTAENHPQLKAPYPIVNGSVALGTDENPVHHMVSMTAEDAAFIAAANPAVVLELIAELEKLNSENKALRKDADRLDPLEEECEAYGTDIHEGNRWVVDGPFATARDAIDAAMSKEAIP